MERKDIVAEIVQQNTIPPSYTVEAIDMANDGSIEMTTFAGPAAEERAKAYAATQYLDYRIAF